MIVPENCLWEDYKYITWFRFPFVRYYIEKNKIYLNEGIVNTISNQVLIEKISTVRYSQSIFQKIFKTATLEIYTIGDANLNITMENIKNAEEVQELIMELMEGKNE